MASVTMASTFLGSATLIRHTSLAVAHRRLVITNSATQSNGSEKVNVAQENGRRDVMFAAAAAAVCSVAGVAMADPSRGTAEARKAFAPVCVTMPTARICHK